MDDAGLVRMDPENAVVYRQQGKPDPCRHCGGFPQMSFEMTWSSARSSSIDWVVVPCCAGFLDDLMERARERGWAVTPVGAD